MLSWISNWWSPRSTPTQARSIARVVRARYDAAVTTDDNRRHWASADGLSPNASNSVEVRRILRNRARYETANNSYARGIVLTLAHDVVGTGPRLQMLTTDSDANRRIENAFMMWARSVQLAEKLRTMRMARATDGESFAILTNNPRLNTEVQLDLRLVEADQVATPDLDRLSTMAVDGIVFDSSGNPIEYHILRNHPGDGFYSARSDYDRISADAVLHWFRADRPGQTRGIPDIMPALPLFAQLRRFTLAVLAAAETAADFAGILYTDAPANGEADAAEPFEPIELEKRALVTMPASHPTIQSRWATLLESVSNKTQTQSKSTHSFGNLSSSTPGLIGFNGLRSYQQPNTKCSKLLPFLPTTPTKPIGLCRLPIQSTHRSSNPFQKKFLHRTS